MCPEFSMNPCELHMMGGRLWDPPWFSFLSMLMSSWDLMTMWTGLSPLPSCCLVSEESLPSFSHASSSAEAPMGRRRSAGAIFVSVTELSFFSLSEVLLSELTLSSVPRKQRKIDIISVILAICCVVININGLFSYQVCCLPVCESSARCCCLCWVNYLRASSLLVSLLVALCWNFPPGSTRVVNPHQESYAWTDPNWTHKGFKSTYLCVHN